MKESVIVGKNSFKLTIAEIASIVFGVFYFVLLTRFFSKEDMASLAIMSVVTGISGMLTGFGFHATAVKVLPDFLSAGRKEKVSAFLHQSYFLIIPSSVIVALVVYFFSEETGRIFFKASGFAGIMKIISAAVFTNKLFETSLHNLTAFQKFTHVSFVKLANNVLVRIIALSLFFAFGIRGYLWGLVAGQFFLSLWMLCIMKQYIFSRIKPGFSRKLLRYSFPFYCNGYIGYLSSHADSLVVSLFLSPPLIATYYVVRKFVDYIESFVTTLTTPLFPKMIELQKSGKETLQKLFYRSTKYLSFILVPVILFVISISYFLLDIYGKGMYMDGLPVLVMLVSGSFFTGFYLLVRGTVFVSGRPVDTTRLEIFKAVINTAVPLALVSGFGIMGIGIGKFLSLAGSVFFAYYAGKKLLLLRFDWDALRFITIISLAPAAMIVLFQLWMYRVSFVFLYMAAGISLFIALFSRFVPAEDRQLFKDIMFKWKN